MSARICLSSANFSSAASRSACGARFTSKLSRTTSRNASSSFSLRSSCCSRTSASASSNHESSSFPPMAYFALASRSRCASTSTSAMARRALRLLLRSSICIMPMRSPVMGESQLNGSATGWFINMNDSIGSGGADAGSSFCCISAIPLATSLMDGCCAAASCHTSSSPAGYPGTAGSSGVSANACRNAAYASSRNLFSRCGCSCACEVFTTTAPSSSAARELAVAGANTAIAASIPVSRKGL